MPGVMLLIRMQSKKSPIAFQLNDIELVWIMRAADLKLVRVNSSHKREVNTLAGHN
jgi:hypothetical protein